MSFHLAQINLAYARGTQDDPVMAEFMAQLDEVNTLAERSEGFVWRYMTDSRDPMQREFEDDRVLFNMSVWQSIEALHAFTYRTHHAKVFAARKQWFEDWAEKVATLRELGQGVPAIALWWIPAGHVPTAEEGKARLRLLGQKGPHAEAFTFKQAFDAAGHLITR